MQLYLLNFLVLVFWNWITSCLSFLTNGIITSAVIYILNSIRLQTGVRNHKLIRKVFTWLRDQVSSRLIFICSGTVLPTIDVAPCWTLKVGGFMHFSVGLFKLASSSNLFNELLSVLRSNDSTWSLLPLIMTQSVNQTQKLRHSVMLLTAPVLCFFFFFFSSLHSVFNLQHSPL